MEVGKPRVYRVSQETIGPGEPVLQFQSTDSRLQKALLLEGSLFVLFRFPADWMRSTHILDSSLLY